MSVTSDDRTLFVAIRVDATPIGGDEAILAVGPYGRYRVAAGKLPKGAQLPKGALFSLDVVTGKTCKERPVWLESEPAAMAIAPGPPEAPREGSLYVVLPTRLFVSSLGALACN
jgi:hypothetical protein